jgi:hypothetical protein
LIFFVLEIKYYLCIKYNKYMNTELLLWGIAFAVAGVGLIIWTKKCPQYNKEDDDTNGDKQYLNKINDKWSYIGGIAFLCFAFILIIEAITNYHK